MKRICCLLVAALIAGAQGYDVQRTAMVRDQIAARGIKNPAVLRAMRETPRELFMPPGVRAFAYEDRAVPIGRGQTISQAYIVAFMTEMLDITKAHRVLEIGTAPTAYKDKTPFADPSVLRAHAGKPHTARPSQPPRPPPSPGYAALYVSAWNLPPVT